MPKFIIQVIPYVGPSVGKCALAYIPPRETSRAAKSEEKRMFSQAIKWAEKIKHISVGLLSQSLLNPTENVFTNIERKKRARVDVQRSFCTLNMTSGTDRFVPHLKFFSLR